MTTELNHSYYGRIPKGWKVTKLKNHLTIKGRIGWKGLKSSEYVNEGPYLVRGVEFINNSVNWKECHRVTDRRYDESPEIKLKEDDILMTKDGHKLGKLAYVFDLPGKATAGSHIHVIRNKSKEIRQKFIFYFFKTKAFKKMLESRIEGSAIPGLYQRDINELEIMYPSLTIQDEILEILTSLDKKIKNLKNQNKVLEPLAQTIFKSCFIDFDGQTEFVDSKIGKIPKDWKVGRLGDLCKIQSGFAFKSKDFQKEGFRIIKIKNIQNNVIDLSFGDCISKSLFNKIEKKFHLFSGNILIAMTGANLGKLGIVPKNNYIYLLNQRVGKIISNDNDFLCYIILNDAESQGFLKAISSGSSAQGNVSDSDIVNISIILPPPTIIKEISKQLNVFHVKITDNLGLINKLEKIRDSLLSKLMSGEIQV